MLQGRVLAVLSLLLSCNAAWGGAPTSTPTPSLIVKSIREQLKPEVLKRVMENRDVMTYAKLEELEGASGPHPELKQYSFYGSMLVRASAKLTQEILTNYPLYAQMIPYIDKAEFNPKENIVKLEGGIFKFRLASTVKFNSPSERIVHYQIIQGHLTGLEGDIVFEPQGEKDTLVYFRGGSIGKAWAPAFIMERGAEIVFELTGKRMRSYIESQKNAPMTVKQGDGAHDPEIPQPRSRLEAR